MRGGSDSFTLGRCKCESCERGVGACFGCVNAGRGGATGAVAGAALAIGVANEEVDALAAASGTDGAMVCCGRTEATLAGRAGAEFVTVEVVEMVEGGAEPGVFAANRRRCVTMP